MSWRRATIGSGDFGSDNIAGIDQVILPEHVTREMLAITLVDWLPPGAQASPDRSPLQALRLQWSPDDSVTIALPRTDAYAIASRAYSPPAPATPGVEAVVVGGQSVALGELLAAAASSVCRSPWAIHSATTACCSAPPARTT